MAIVSGDPFPVFRAIVGVDHKEVVVVVYLVEVSVVEGSAVLVGNVGVMRFSSSQSPGIIGEYVAKVGLRVGSGESEPSHVTHIKQPSMAPRGKMLGDDAGFVLDRHLPSRKIDNGGAVAFMPAVEGGTTQPWRGCFSHRPWSLCLASPMKHPSDPTLTVVLGRHPVPIIDPAIRQRVSSNRLPFSGACTVHGNDNS